MRSARASGPSSARCVSSKRRRRFAPSDAVAPAAGSRQQIGDALAVCFAFNTTDRLADTFEFFVPGHKAFEAGRSSCSRALPLTRQVHLSKLAVRAVEPMANGGPAVGISHRELAGPGGAAPAVENRESVHLSACTNPRNRLMAGASSSRIGDRQPIKKTEMRKETLRCETDQLDDAPVTSRDEGDLPPPRERSLSTLYRWTPTAGTPRAHSDSKWYCPGHVGSRSRRNLRIASRPA